MFTNNPFAAVTEDVLSSQANIAGYRAVLDAARLYEGRFFIGGFCQTLARGGLGAGVAGL